MVDHNDLLNPNTKFQCISVKCQIFLSIEQDEHFVPFLSNQNANL